MTKKKKNQRGPYKCTRCKEYGHRADNCPNEHKFQTLLNSMSGPDALDALIPEFVQISTVVDGITSAALVGAIKGNDRLVARGMPPSNSIVNAWAELTARAAKIDTKAINAARLAREARDRAEIEYQAALAPIRAALGHEKARTR